MAARIVVFGDINQDFVVRAERMPRPGETVVGSDLRLVPGGKCANQAVTAARLGADVTLIGRVGTDVFGAELLANLEREGIDSALIARDPDEATGTAFITVAPSDENSILVCMGANGAIAPAQVEGAAETIARADMLLVQLGAPLESVLRGMEIAHEASTPVLFDPAPVHGDLAPMWPHVAIATPNETEAEAIAGQPVTDVPGAAAAAAWFRDRGVHLAIVKLGAQGALALDDDGARLVRGYTVEGVDTTGAGDAFAGALAVRLAEGVPVDEALSFANAAGAVAASRFGAQTSLPTRAEVDALMAGQQAEDRVVPVDA